MHRLQSLSIALIAALSGVISNFAAADEHTPRLYKVEMIVFAYEQADPDEANLRAAGLPASAADDARPLSDTQAAVIPLTAAAAQRNSTLPATSFTLFSSTAREWNSLRARLQRQADLRVLFHGAWYQPVSTPEQARPVRIQGGDRFDAQHELEGYVTLSVSRYLHLNARLYLHQFASASFADIPLEFLQAEGANPLLESLQQEERLYRKVGSAQLHQARRMRSGEIHYLDHPLMGMLIEVKPLDHSG